MAHPSKKPKFKVRKTSSKGKGKPSKGTTISVPPAEIECTYESNFESKPLWVITVKRGLGTWAKDKKGEWKKKDFRNTPRVLGEVLELDSAEKTSGASRIKYVLIKHGGNEKWINVGKVKKKQNNNYRLDYEYARKHGVQYGIKGTAKVKYGKKTLDLKLLAVTHKTRQNQTKSTPFTLVGRGRYKGYLQVRGKYRKKYKDDGLWK
ncbi:MAG: hypothetical protein JRE23_11515 [Deltaproteobacteria bacterium]|nr:hypothetical protein [Deltaproteobacteria bacterium]